MTYCECMIKRYADLCNRWATTTFADETRFYSGQVLALCGLLKEWGHDVCVELEQTDSGRFQGFKSITVDGNDLLRGWHCD